MLPSFRLIAAAFLCGFLVVFAGLRIAASLNDIHETLPVTAANSASEMTGWDSARSLAAPPALFDLRFVGSASMTPVLARMTSPSDRIAATKHAPVTTPPAVIEPIEAAPFVPPGAETQTPDVETAVTDRPRPARAMAIDIPPIAAAAVDLSPSATEIHIKLAAIPMIAPASVDLAPSATDVAIKLAAIPMIEPAAVDMSPSVTDLAAKLAAIPLIKPAAIDMSPSTTDVAAKLAAIPLISPAPVDLSITAADPLSMPQPSATLAPVVEAAATPADHTPELKASEIPIIVSLPLPRRRPSLHVRTPSRAKITTAKAAPAKVSRKAAQVVHRVTRHHVAHRTAAKNPFESPFGPFGNFGAGNTGARLGGSASSAFSLPR